MDRFTFERLRNEYIRNSGDPKAYAKLLAGGEDTVKFILEDFLDALLWPAFDLLNELVDDGPKISKKEQGDLSKMRFRWFIWGMKKGLV